MTILSEPPTEVDEEVTRPPLFTRYMRHDPLDAMLRRHPELRGTRVAALAESLRDGVVMGV
jgi:hypothetical protein